MRRIPYLQIAMIAALLVAIFCRMPYGFYTLLKVLCCAGFGYLAYKAHDRKLDAWMWIFGVVAIVYNPFIKVHLGREIWSVVNLATIALAGISIGIVKGGRK